MALAMSVASSVRSASSPSAVNRNLFRPALIVPLLVTSAASEIMTCDAEIVLPALLVRLPSASIVTRRDADRLPSFVTAPVVVMLRSRSASMVPLLVRLDAVPPVVMSVSRSEARLLVIVRLPSASMTRSDVLAVISPRSRTPTPSSLPMMLIIPAETELSVLASIW